MSEPSSASTAPIIRSAHAGDVSAMLAIYAPLVRDTTISFEYEPPTRVEMEQRLQAIQRDHPWLVCERDGQVAGYAYASAFRSRPAYRWTAEVTVYIHADHGRRGLAQTLYREALRAAPHAGLSHRGGGHHAAQPGQRGLARAPGLPARGHLPERRLQAR